jgi:hypothetical protein
MEFHLRSLTQITPNSNIDGRYEKLIAGLAMSRFAPLGPQKNKIAEFETDPDQDQLTTSSAALSPLRLLDDEVLS